MIGKPSASQDSSFHDDNTAAENGHGIHTPDIDDHPLRPPAAAHLHTGKKNIEHEKPAPSRPHKPHRSRRNEHDAEKVSFHRKSIPAQPIYAFPRYPQHSAYPDDLYETDDDDTDEEDGPKRHSVWILLYLSTLAPLLALPLALYTLLTALLLLLILYPLRLCTTHWPSPTTFHRLLSPPPLFQLGLIFSPHLTSTAHNLTINRILTLVVVNVLSPIYAIAIAGAAWVAAVFWAYTAILGNPDGKEERDDGREAVLAVRRWWERWLVQGLE